jgi:hypothetical protein
MTCLFQNYIRNRKDETLVDSCTSSTHASSLQDIITPNTTSEEFASYTKRIRQGSDPLTEINIYLCKPTLNIEKSPNVVLDYWKANEKRLPILALMAKDILSVQASSVASESVIFFDAS